MVQEFPGNSRRAPAESDSTEEQQGHRVEQGITGKVIRRKKPFGRRIKELVFGTEGVGSYLVGDVLLPAIRDLVSDLVIQGVERTIYPDSEPRRSRTRGRRSALGSRSPHISYDDQYRGPSRSAASPARRGAAARPNRSSVDLEDIILANRVDAVAALTRMDEMLAEYDTVSVGDLYDYIGQTTTPLDYKFGWVDLGGADVRRISEGWLLVLPKPERL